MCYLNTTVISHWYKNNLWLWLWYLWLYIIIRLCIIIKIKILEILAAIILLIPKRFLYFFLWGSHSYKSRYYASFLRIRSKTLFFPITQNTHDFVSTSVRRIHNTDDVVMSSYRRWNNVLCLLGNSRIKDGIFPISLLRQTEQKYRGLSVFDTQW